MGEDIIIIKSFFLLIFLTKCSTKISKHSYFYKDLFTSTIVENDIFYLSILDDWFRWLFRTTTSDYYSWWPFPMTVSAACFRLLFRMTVSVTVRDDDFGWRFQMTIPDDNSDDYFGSSKMIDLETRMKHIRI